MKRLILMLLVLLVAVPNTDARRRKPKAGDMKDSVYVDATYGFKFTVRDNWSVRIKGEEDNARIILNQKNWDTPLTYQEAPDYTAVPRMVVYADTSMMGIYPFLDSLMSESYDSDQKDRILKEFEFLSEPDVVPRGRNRLEIGGESGVLWKGQAKYVKEIQTSAASAGGKRVGGSYGGAIAAVKKGDTILLFYIMCEWDFYDGILAEALSMVTSLEWVDSGADDEES